MHFNVEVFKKHPWAIAGVLAAGLLVFVYYKNRGSGASPSAAVGVPTVSDAVQQSQIQAATQLQLAAAAGAAQNNQEQFQLAALHETQAGNYAMADLQAKTSTTQQVNAITGQLEIQGQQLSTQKAIAMATVGADVAKTLAADQLSLELSKNQTAANVATAQILSNEQINIANINATAMTTAAQYQADVAKEQIQASADVAKHGQNVSSGNSPAGIIGDVIGGVAGIFGL